MRKLTITAVAIALAFTAHALYGADPTPEEYLAYLKLKTARPVPVSTPAAIPALPNTFPIVVATPKPQAWPLGFLPLKWHSGRWYTADGKWAAEPGRGWVSLVKAKPVAKAAPRAWPNYPVRGNWWSGCGSWRHLTTGEHRGQFDTVWLQSLSNAEIQSLHSDHHQGRTKWQYVVRPGQAAPRATVRRQAAPRTTVSTSSGCPGGRCPSSSRSGLFGGLFRR